MPIVLTHPDGNVRIEELSSGKKRIEIQPVDQESYVSKYSWDTSYPVELIEKIFRVKGPAFLCDEIMREEDKTYLENYIKYALLSYFDLQNFDDKVLLDFGCGCGASTMILKRLLPNTQIIAVELLEEFLEIAKLRSNYYGFDRLSFIVSPESECLPDSIGEFDYVLLNGVYEHLLPNERNILLPIIWKRLKSNGVLFINDTPHRYSPIETHTTGLPMINYLSDQATLHLTRRVSKRIASDEKWETLLRKGIRGGHPKEIMNILNWTDQKPILLTPNKLGIENQSEIWFEKTLARKLSTAKKLVVSVMKALQSITGLPLSPYLSIAIQKQT